MRLKASDFRASIDLSGGMTVSFAVSPRSVGDAKAAYDELNGRDLEITVKPWREKRSKNANDYLWELCTRLAEKIGSTKDDVYRHHIRMMGVNEIYTISEEAVDAFNEIWQKNGTGWFIDRLDTFSGLCTIAVYSGSSQYDTAQMSRLISSVIEDCKEQGIETATPDEIARMESRWEQSTKRNA